MARWICLDQQKRGDLQEKRDFLKEGEFHIIS